MGEWTSNPGLFRASSGLQAADGGRYRLVVEHRPGTPCWEWSCWHSRDEARCRTGRAGSDKAARLAAEQAALGLDRAHAAAGDPLPGLGLISGFARPAALPGLVPA